MKKIFLVLCLVLLMVSQVAAAPSATTVWEFNSSGTAGMLNGCGFDTAYAATRTDYSLQNQAEIYTNNTDGAATGTTTFTNVLATFTQQMEGNYIHITNGGTGLSTGWFELLTYTDAHNVVLDRTPGTGTGATYYVGGNCDLTGSLVDSFFEQIVGGNTVFIKAGTYGAMTSSISVAATSCSGTTPCNIFGYTTTRSGVGDTPTGTGRPLIDVSTLLWTAGQYQNLNNIRFTGSAATMLTTGIGTINKNLYAINTSGTADRTAVSVGVESAIINSELISTNGRGINIGIGDGSKVIGSYIHDSKDCVRIGKSNGLFAFNIIDNCTNSGINFTGTASSGVAVNNTIYGLESSLVGTGILFDNSTSIIFNTLYNNLIYGWATPIAQTTAQQKSNSGSYNNLYNNTNAVSNYTLDATDLALDPAWVSGPPTTSLDWRVGTNMKAVAFPGAFNGTNTTGYLDIGAVQRIEPTGGSVRRR